MKGFDQNADMLGMMFTLDGLLHVHKVNETCTKIKSQLTPDEIRDLNQAVFPRVA